MFLWNFYYLREKECEFVWQVDKSHMYHVEHKDYIQIIFGKQFKMVMIGCPKCWCHTPEIDLQTPGHQHGNLKMKRPPCNLLAPIVFFQNRSCIKQESASKWIMEAFTLFGNLTNFEQQ